MWWGESHSVVSDSLQPHELYSPWNSPGQNSGEVCCSLLQGIFPTQALNPILLRCGHILCQLSHKGSPRILVWGAYPFSSGSSRPRNWTGVSCIAGGFFTNWAIRKALCASVLIRKRQSYSSYKIELVFYWYGLNCDHPLPTPNLYVEAINPSTSESDCIWRWVSKEMIKFKWDLRVGPKPIWPMSLEEEEIWAYWETTEAHMHKKTTAGHMRREIMAGSNNGMALCKPEGERPQRQPVRPALWSWTPSLQNCENINSSCLSHPAWATLLRPQEMNTVLMLSDQLSLVSRCGACAGQGSWQRAHSCSHTRWTCGQVQRARRVQREGRTGAGSLGCGGEEAAAAGTRGAVSVRVCDL